MQDILLDNGNDLAFTEGDFAVGESQLQEVFLILQTNKGEWKEDPVTGCNLLQLINGKGNNLTIQQRIKLQLTRDGKNYEDYVKQLKWS